MQYIIDEVHDNLLRVNITRTDEQILNALDFSAADMSLEDGARVTPETAYWNSQLWDELLHRAYDSLEIDVEGDELIDRLGGESL